MTDDLMKNLSDQLVQAKNKFQFVLEMPELYRSAQLYDRCIQALSLLRNSKLGRKDKVKLDLGLIYMNRTRSDQSPTSLLNQVRNLREETKDDHRLEYLRNFVEGAILLSRVRDYSLAVKYLEDIEQQTRGSESHFLYALVKKTLADAYMFIGRHVLSEIAYQDALSTFRRYGHRMFLAYTFNNFGVLKKKTCRYSESETLLKSATGMFRSLGNSGGEVLSTLNLGILYLKTGNWRTAELLLSRADGQNSPLVGHNLAISDFNDSDYGIACNVNFEHLLILRRQFVDAERRLIDLLTRYEENPSTKRMVALAHEFLGEMYHEMGQRDQAEFHLTTALTIAKSVLPRSDLMTEIERRFAESQSNYMGSGVVIKRLINNIRLCQEIDDKLEFSASLRILGEMYAKDRMDKKAVSCFEFAIRTLKEINESYELMRTCLAYGSVLVRWRSPDAEVYLLQARQLCKSLELDFFLAKVDIEYSKLEIYSENFSGARERISETGKIYESLQKCDQAQLKPHLEGVAAELEQSIMRKSVSGAKELKAICRVYEEARFPMENLKPDLAYQVAQSVNADSLFLIKRRGKGYVVPLVYNLPVNVAKEMVRRLDRDSKRPLLGIEGDPKVFRMHTGQSLVCVPTKNESGFILCTCIASGRNVSPRQFEFLFASAEAIERLVDSDIEVPNWVGCDFIDGSEKLAATHPRGTFGEILTVTQNMIRLIRLAERASLSQETILLEGETGVGKELFAKAIHANSCRHDKPCVAINAGGMPVSLLESQLFGHVRGAFTDAVKDRIGLIEDADGGTVFLDEVGEMGPELQVKLLRLLENGEFRRLGENQVRIANVRVVSATNRDLLKEVERGNFRRDLYYRLGTVKLQIPPLRFRQRDIELLIRHFLRQCASRYGHIDRYFEIDVKAMEALDLYDWPGNVRELQNEIRRIVSLIGEGNVIRFGMLSQHIKEYLESKHRSDGLLERSVDRYERRLILDALTKNDWNRLRTAEELGVPRTTLLAKMRRLNVAAR